MHVGFLFYLAVLPAVALGASSSCDRKDCFYDCCDNPNRWEDSHTLCYNKRYQTCCYNRYWTWICYGKNARCGDNYDECYGGSGGGGSTPSPLKYCNGDFCVYLYGRKGETAKMTYRGRVIKTLSMTNLASDLYTHRKKVKIYKNSAQGSILVGLSGYGRHNDIYGIYAFKTCSSTGYCYRAGLGDKLPSGCGHVGLQADTWTFISKSGKTEGRLTFGLAGSPRCSMKKCYAGSGTIDNGSCSFSTQIRGNLHLANIGDRVFYNSGWLGYTGISNRVEGFSLSLPQVSSSECSMQYMVHVANKGDTQWYSENQYAGTKGEGLSIEGLKIRLTGSCTSSYGIKYKCHLANVGDTSWVQDGGYCGTTGQGRPLEAFRVELYRK